MDINVANLSRRPRDPSAPLRIAQAYRLCRAVVIRGFTHKFVITLKHRLPIQKIAFVWFCTIAGGLAQQSPAPTQSIVCKAHDPDAIKDYKTNSIVVRGM